MSDRKGKTRYETVYVDKFGREAGREPSGGGSSSNRESSRQEPQDIPRSSLRPDAPRRSSTATTLTYGGSSARHSTKDRPRRESESLSTRPHLKGDHEDRAELIPVRDEDSKNYHKSGGYTGRSRDDGSYDPADSSSTRRPSHSTRSPPPRDWVASSSSSQLRDSMARMTVNEDLESPQYTYSNRDLPPIDDYEDDRSQAQLPPLSSSNHDLRVGSLYDKGKGIARDISPAPALPGISKHLVKGTRGETEKLDKNYAKRSGDYKKFFRPGRVFSTLWTESYDDSMQSENDQFRSVVTYEVSYKQRVFSKIRRFVVVKKDDRSCTCLPVTTYDGRGYKKRGINLNNHGLIFSSRDPPLYVEGITKEPLKIILSKGAEKLVNPSYLNYGRVYTVETNVKVRDVGELNDRSKELLRSYYKAVQLDDLLDDEGTGPGMTSNLLPRAVEIAGVGTSFSNNMPNSGYEGRGGYDRSSGGYNQQPGWNNPGGAPLLIPATHNPYVTQPQYPSHAASGFPSTGPTYQYADVSQSGYQQQDHRYSHDTSVARGVPQQGYQQSDNRYIQDQSASSGFATSQSMTPGHATSLYSSGTDPSWSQGQFFQPQYSSSRAPVRPSGMHAGRGEGYSPADDPRYMNSGRAPDPYYDSHVTDGRPGRQNQYSLPIAPGPQANFDQEEILLPTEQEAQREQDRRRERRDSDRDRNRDPGRGRYHYEN